MIPRYPLAWPAGWPRAEKRRSANFGTRSGAGYKRELTIMEATKRVLYELERLGVRDPGDIVISTNIPLRLDGLPRSDAGNPQDAGAAVYWTRGAGTETKVMAIDSYMRVADNLAAIAATLEAMRSIERYGGAKILERAFTGFDALPPPAPPTDWRRVLGLAPDCNSMELVNAKWRSLATIYHPDRGGAGNPGRMAEINRARDEARKELLPCDQ